MPVIVKELKAARISGRKTVDYRMALMSVIEGMGPAAEGAVPVLTEIVQDEKERNDFVLLKARMALTAIGTPLSPANRQSIRPEKRGAVATEGIPQGSCRSRCSALLSHAP